MCCRAGDDCNTDNVNFDYCSDEGIIEPDLLKIACPYLPDTCGSQQEFVLVPETDMWENDGISSVYSLGTATDSFRNDQCMYHIQGNIALNEAFRTTHEWGANELKW